jgi:hypothetical protein
MAARVFTAIKRFVLWDYPRASWQYDLMVGLILAFIFLTPRQWFRDQPRVPRASRIAELPGTPGMQVFFVDAELLADVSEAERLQSAGRLIHRQTGGRQAVVRLEPVFDSEKEVKGFMAFTRP